MQKLMRGRCMQFLLLLLLQCAALLSQAQATGPRPLPQLINKQEPAWPYLSGCIASAKNRVEVLPKDSVRADSALYETQVTTRSPMGAVVYETGGILIDGGWIRILGSGSPKLDRSLMGWNKGKSFEKVGQQISFLLIADDVLGGFFAINNGGIDSTGFGEVYYFAPDAIKWQSTGLTYSAFLQFCFSGDLALFYKGFRWTGWEKEVQAMNGNQGVYMFPTLWSLEGQQDINKNTRRVVPIQELWDLYFTKK